MFLPTFGDTPVSFSEDMSSAVVVGDRATVRAQLELAKAIDVDDYADCVRVNQPADEGSD